MNRDRRLRGLSSQHHQALVIARALTREPLRWGPAEGEALVERFARELEPHFAIEEEVLLPALRAAGEVALAERTQADHDALRAALPAIGAGDGEAARGFGRRLGEHVKFEEREVFPACERLLAEGVLAEVAARAPWDE